MTRKNNPENETAGDAGDAPATALATVGVGQIAYVKAVTVEGNELFAIHAADGEPLAVVENRGLAFSVIRQNDLEPVSVH